MAGMANIGRIFSSPQAMNVGAKLVAGGATLVGGAVIGNSVVGAAKGVETHFTGNASTPISNQLDRASSRMMRPKDMPSTVAKFASAMTGFAVSQTIGDSIQGPVRDFTQTQLQKHFPQQKTMGNLNPIQGNSMFMPHMKL